MIELIVSFDDIVAKENKKFSVWLTSGHLRPSLDWSWIRRNTISYRICGGTRSTEIHEI